MPSFHGLDVNSEEAYISVHLYSFSMATTNPITPGYTLLCNKLKKLLRHANKENMYEMLCTNIIMMT